MKTEKEMLEIEAKTANVTTPNKKPRWPIVGVFAVICLMVAAGLHILATIKEVKMAQQKEQALQQQFTHLQQQISAQQQQLAALQVAWQKELAHLRWAPAPNQNTLLRQLANLDNYILALPVVPTPLIAENAQRSPVGSTEQAPWWQRAYQGVVQALQQLIVVTHRKPDNVLPLLEPVAERLVKQQLSALLIQTRFAILQHDNFAYSQGLALLRELVLRYFPASPSRQTLLTAIAQLEKIAIVEAAPPSQDAPEERS